MSRSYKKEPVLKDSTRGMKTLASRAVRRKEDVPNGGAYKKFFCSYDISDFSFREPSLEDYYWYRFAKSDEEREQAQKNWEKWFWRK